MRIRSIKPGFFKNDELANLPAVSRLLFIGLWCMADGHGKLADRPKKIKVEVLPYERCNIDEMLDELCHCGFILRYTRDGKSVIFIKEFSKHQRVSGKEAMEISEYPDPPSQGSSGEAMGKQSGSNGEAVIALEGKGREGKGRESESEKTEQTPLTDAERIRGLSPWVQWRCRDPEATKDNQAEVIGLLDEHGPKVVAEASQRAVMANGNKKVWPNAIRDFLPRETPAIAVPPPDHTHEAARALILSNGWEECARVLEVPAKSQDDMLMVINGPMAAKALVDRLGKVSK